MKYLLYPLILLFIALGCVEIIPVVKWSAANVATYQWMLYGLAGYLILRKTRIISRNELWLQTFSHELSHTIVSLMFFQKIHSFQAEEDTGVMYRSGSGWGGIFITLAPYCLPIYTYLFIFLRLLGAVEMFYIFDILIGFTLAFHLVSFWKQTRPYQTDIQKYGYLLSYLFIIAFLIFNLTIIISTIRFGVIDAAINLFTHYWSDIKYCWQELLSLINDFKQNS